MKWRREGKSLGSLKHTAEIILIDEINYIFCSSLYQELYNSDWLVDSLKW